MDLQFLRHLLRHQLGCGFDPICYAKRAVEVDLTWSVRGSKADHRSNSPPQTLHHPLLPSNAGVSRSLILLACVAFSTAQTLAQEALRPSAGRIKAQTTLPKSYNLKVGPGLFRFHTGLRTEYNDNINLTSGTVETGPKESDMTISPSFGVSARWQVTKLNNLELTTTFGYTKYLNHPELDTQQLLISPDSAIQFNIYTGDVRINLHDRFSIQQDPIGNGALSNVSKLTTLTNTIGVSVLWDINDVLVNVGYDHTDFITLAAVSTAGDEAASDLKALDRSTDQVYAATFLQLASNYGGGVEAVASATRFLEDSSNDMLSLAIGPFFEMQVTRYTKAFLALGYQANFSEGGEATGTSGAISNPFFAARATAPTVSTAQETSRDTNSYYLNLTIVHRLNRFYDDKLSIGHIDQVGLLAQRSKSTYARYSSVWKLNRRFNIGFGLFFEDVEETGGLGGSKYDRYGLTLDTGYQITKKLTAGLSYQFTRKRSDVMTLDYDQNRVALTLSYQF